jgi:hypothetical protein
MAVVRNSLGKVVVELHLSARVLHNTISSVHTFNAFL